MTRDSQGEKNPQCYECRARDVEIRRLRLRLNKQDKKKNKYHKDEQSFK